MYTEIKFKKDYLQWKVSKSQQSTINCLWDGEGRGGVNPFAKNVLFVLYMLGDHKYQKLSLPVCPQRGWKAMIGEIRTNAITDGSRKRPEQK